MGVLGEDLETESFRTCRDPTMPGDALGETKASPKFVKGGDS